MRAIFSLCAATLAGVALAAACGGKVVVEGGGGTGTGGTTSGSGASHQGGAGGVDYGACNGPGECVVRSASCCGTCGQATPSDMIGLATTAQDAYATAVCVGQSCPDCFTQPDPNLFAYCDAGHCRAVDLRTSPLSACNSPSDCVLRWGTSCCEGCGTAPPAEMVALTASQEAALRALVCTPAQPCPGCAVSYPPDAVTDCQAGHCVASFLVGP